MASPRTFILRPIDNRQSTDRIYQVVSSATTGTDSAQDHHLTVSFFRSLVMSPTQLILVALEFNPGSVTMSNDASDEKL